jgi:hypothetical protein
MIERSGREKGSGGSSKSEGVDIATLELNFCTECQRVFSFVASGLGIGAVRNCNISRFFGSLAVANRRRKGARKRRGCCWAVQRSDYGRTVQAPIRCSCTRLHRQFPSRAFHIWWERMGVMRAVLSGPAAAALPYWCLLRPSSTSLHRRARASTLRTQRPFAASRSNRCAPAADFEEETGFIPLTGSNRL